MSIGIYKITCPTGKIYVGQSCNIEERFNSYKKLRCKTQPKLFESLCMYGYMNHIFSVLELCSKIDLNYKERYYQELFDSNGVNGLNGILCKGSKNQRQVLSIEHKSKISKSLLGRPAINRKRVQCTKTFVVFESIKDCSLKMGINYNTLKHKLNGSNKIPSIYKYYLDEII